MLTYNIDNARNVDVKLYLSTFNEQQQRARPGFCYSHMNQRENGNGMDNSVRLFINDMIEKAISIKGLPKKVLEIGPFRKPDKSLITLGCLQHSLREGISLTGPFTLQNQINVFQGTSNEMGMFEDGRFDMVLSNAVLEHDRYFWRSIEEYKRVLSIGGTLIIGVPGFVPSDGLRKLTQVYKYHMEEDYYRFSPLAVSNIFFEGFDSVEVYPILHPPRIIGVGTKV